MDTVCGDLQRAARKHMKDLAWTDQKREGGGEIIDWFIRACFIQGLHDDRLNTMVKAKGNVNTPMTVSRGRVGGGKCHKVGKFSKELFRERAVWTPGN
jgi:hypothetical protein